MASLNDYAEKKILDHIFGNTPFSTPSTLYVGLATGVTDAGAITGEPTSLGYARVAVVNNTTNWPNASGTSPATKANGAAITFPTASGSWGELTHFFISDASTSGNIIAWGVLTLSVSPVSGEAVSFAVGDLVITLD